MNNDILYKIKQPGNKLWVYGDSFSFPTKDEKFTQEYYETCSSYNKSYHVDKFWFDYIAEKRNFETIIMGEGGRSNSWILRSIAKSMKYWKSSDEIYIGHTSLERYEYPFDNKLNKLASPYEVHENKNKIPWLGGFHKSWILSADCQLEFWNNLNDIVEFGNLNGFKIKSWFWGNYLNNIETFSLASNNEVENGHPSPRGSYQLYEIIEKIPFGSRSELNKHIL